MPRQPWQRRVVACGAGAPASVCGRPQLLTSCCTLAIAQTASSVPMARSYSQASRRDSAPSCVHPAAVSRQAAAASQHAPQQVANAPAARPAVGAARLHVHMTSSSNCMCTPLGSVLQTPLARPPTQPDRRRHALSGWHASGHARAYLGQPHLAVAAKQRRAASAARVFATQRSSLPS